MRRFFLAIGIISFTILYSCKKEKDESQTQTAVERTFGGKINLNNLFNYGLQTRPSYITKDNSGSNPISDKIATLGRVLFYDKQLSSDNSIACASCHLQKFAFSDTATASKGVNGNTGRHSMRLVNNRFSQEVRYFWDERAESLEKQTTMPIQDHNEMGYSGQNGDPSINDLIAKLSKVDYYQELFNFAFGSAEINETKIQLALSQFVRSIQSFDSKFDAGRAQSPNDGAPFQNFTQQENMGKNLFLQAPVFDGSGNRTGGGLGCQGCHRAPEFDIDPASKNNGIIAKIGGGKDLNNTKSPTLRDLFQPNGSLNGKLMHNAVFSDIQSVVNHYNSIPSDPDNNNLDPRLNPNGNPQKLNLTQQESSALIAFLKTLSGTNIYSDEKWSNPFRQ